MTPGKLCKSLTSVEGLKTLEGKFKTMELRFSTVTKGQEMGSLMDFCYNVITHSLFYQIFVSIMHISTMYKKVSHELETYMEQKTSCRVGDYYTGQEEKGLSKACVY